MPDVDTALEPAQVGTVIYQLVRLVAPVAQPSITARTRLVYDLGFHSLALAELTFNLEDIFRLDAIGPEQTMNLSAAGDIVTLVERSLAESQAQLPTVGEVSALCQRYGAAWNPAD